MHAQAAESASDDYSDEEVAVVAGGRRLWVRGVRSHTTCRDVVGALLDTDSHLKDEEATDPEGEWVLAERWRGVERPLSAEARVLSVLDAWGEARHEVRLSLRYTDLGACDSGRESTEPRPPPPPPRPAPPCMPAMKLASVIAHQSRTIHQQIDKLREQEKQIDLLEDQAHKTRMEKHGSNYLLESYLRDLGKTNEIANDSQAGTSDSGVGGGSGTPPRRHTKHKSRRERHLMREHYFTKELTDICQINSERLAVKEKDSDDSGDELTKIQEEIELLEKMAIINKRLQKEEELLVRLGAKFKRYLAENEVSGCNSTTQIIIMLERLSEDSSNTNIEMENNELELEKTKNEIEESRKLMDELTQELEREDLEQNRFEYELPYLRTHSTPLESFTSDDSGCSVQPADQSFNLSPVLPNNDYLRSPNTDILQFNVSPATNIPSHPLPYSSTSPLVLSQLPSILKSSATYQSNILRTPVADPFNNIYATPIFKSNNPNQFTQRNTANDLNVVFNSSPSSYPLNTLV